MSVSNYIPLNIDIATINTSNVSKNIFLPATSSIYGKTISVKDITGFASLNNIIVRSQGVDRFQDSTSNYIINKNFGVASFFAKSNVWYLMNDSSQLSSNLVVNSVRADYYYGDGSGLSNTGFGLSSLSSIVAYGLSTIYSPTGVSSLSSIVAYGLSSVNGGEGVSSLSSIVSYGLSSIAAGEGVSSLSSIIAYGLSTLSGGQGISSLSSIVAYGLSSLAAGEGVSSLSSIVAYGLSTLERQPAPGVSSLSSIVAYGLSSVNGGGGVSSLSSIVSYGLSTVAGGQGISSLSSIVAYGLSTIAGGHGLSSLSSIVAYGLSTLQRQPAPGVSSLSSIVAYGLSTVAGGHGVSSLSSIVAYGLSTLQMQPAPGVSSLSSIVAYGLSSVNAGQGISSLSSIVAYGLSTVASGHGLSSLSSIVAYGLSTLQRQPAPGVSSLSSIIGYGLSSVNAGTGVSSLSSIIAYGLSSIKNNIEEVRALVGDASGILGSNTWNPEGFYPDYVGGAGIRDINNSQTDTVTNAIAKLDDWIYKNIVDQPTAPSYFGKSNSISSINYYWTNPKQFKIGILNIFSPYISSLHMNLYSNTNSMLFSSFMYSGSYIPNSEFTVEGVDFISTDSNSDIITYKNPSFANKNTIRIPIDSKIFNINSGPYFLELYFRNFSSNSYKILPFGSNNINNIGVPAQPNSVSFINISLSNAFIQIQKSNLHSINPDVFDYPALNNYQITLCNIAPPSRRYTGIITEFIQSKVFENSNYPYIAPLQSNSLNNTLLPDSQYIATVKVRNIVNSNYSVAKISDEFRTLLPDQPGTLTSITPLSNGFSNTRIVFQNISNVVVYNRNTFGVGGGLQFTTNSDLGIHSSNNPGSNGASIASISLIVTGPTGTRDSNTLNLNGFPIVSATTSNSNTNTIVQASNIRDFHSGNIIQSNFFMSFTANAILRESYLTASSNPYTFSMIHSNSEFNNRTVHYNISNYIDDLATVAPSLISISNTINSQSNWVSGVPAYSYSTYLAFNNDLSNLARFFYINNQNLLTGSLRFSGTTLTDFTCNINTPLHTTTDVLQLNAPLSNVTRIKTEITLPGLQTLFTPANNTGLRIQASLAFSNLFGTTTPTSNLPFYVDGPSEHLLKTIINSVTSPTGIRVESDGGSNNGLTAGTYLNTQRILGNTGGTINYNVELPLVGGLFRTGGALSNLYNSFAGFQVPTGIGANAYTNLTNYNNISGESTNRFATFRFDLSNSTTKFINNFTLSLSNQFGLILSNSTYNSLAVPYFYYRVHGIPGYNTGWLNANSLRSDANPFTDGISNVGGIRNDISVTSNSRALAIVPIPTTCNYSIYVKIGLKMDCNISFQNFSVIPNINSLPPPPANVRLSSNISITGSGRLNLEWNTPTACNPPLQLYNFSIIPGIVTINGTQYPRRFGGSIIQEPYFSNINCNLPTPLVQTSFSFSNIASNYDTPYYGTVALENDSGLGDYSSNGYIITALPSNRGVEFGGTLRPSGTPPVSYSTGEFILFANRSGGIIQNSLIYTSNTLFTNNISRPFITNSDITVNPQDGYIGFKNNNTVWEIQLCNLTSKTPLRSISYRFSNTFFGSSSSQNISNGDSDGTLFLLSNVQDMYSNDVYRSRFYLVATPVITLSNTRIPASSNLYSLSLTDTSRSIRNSLEFYVDNLVGLSSASLEVENTGNIITFCNICGVSVITSTIFNFWINTINIGSYFFDSTPVNPTIGNMSPIGANNNLRFNISNTPFYWSNNSNSIYTQSPISNTTYFYWSNVRVTNSNFGCNYPVSGFIFSPITRGGGLTGSFTPYFDFESIPLMNCNVRVESSGTVSNYPASGTFGAPYDHTKNISSTSVDTNYRLELQLSKGAFRSAPNTQNNCFLNYTPYFKPSSALAVNRVTYLSPFTLDTFRFVTFKHSFSSLNTSNRVNLLSINLIWADRIPAVTDNNYDTIKFKFYIRFNSNIPTQSNDSSEWLIVRSNSSPIRTFITKNNQDDTLGVASNVVNLVTGSNPRYTIVVPEGCGYGNFDVYTRVGLFTGDSGGYALSNIIVNISNQVNVTNQFTFNCNTTGATTTISFGTPYGLPSNTYFRLSNILHKNNAGNFVSISSNSSRMSPVSNSYIIATESNEGSYSNYTTIHSASGSLFWTGSYRFSIPNNEPVPEIRFQGHNYSYGDTYEGLFRIFTISGASGTVTPTNIKTYYRVTNAINPNFRGPDTFTGEYDYADLIRIGFNSLTGGTISAYNSNTETGKISITSNLVFNPPGYQSPPPQARAPTFLIISFDYADPATSFTISCPVIPNESSGSINYAWTIGTNTITGTYNYDSQTTNPTIRLNNRTDPINTSVSITGNNTGVPGKLNSVNGITSSGSVPTQVITRAPAPSFSKVEFSGFNASGQYTASTTLTRGAENVTTRYTWNVGSANRSEQTATTTSISLTNENQANGTTYSISGINSPSTGSPYTSDSVSGGGTSSTIYKSTGSIEPGSAEPNIPRPTGAISFQVILITGASGHNPDLEANGSFTIRRTAGYDNDACTYIVFYST